MSAKDTADAILRDFRTSMADSAVYLFDSDESAQAVLDAIEQPDYLLVELHEDSMIRLSVLFADERMLSI